MEYGVGFRQRFYRAWWLGYTARNLFEEYLRSRAVEKRGVLDNENEAPKPEKQASVKPVNPVNPQCGDDPMSKLAEAVAGEKRNEKPTDKPK